MVIHRIWKSLVFLSILDMENGFRLNVDPLSVNSPLAKNNNLVTSERKAKEILFRYGYLRCYPRKLKHALMSSNNSPKYKHCGRKLMREAVSTYQRSYGLSPTGKFDEITLSHMSMSRCGNPDFNASLLAKHRLRHDKAGRTYPNTIPVLNYRRKRETRSTNKNLTRDVPVGTVSSRRKTWFQEYIRKMDDEFNDPKKVNQTVRRKRYASRHRRNRILATEIIKWRLVSSAYSDQLTMRTQRAALALAFRMWSEVIPLIFLEDTRSSVHDVDILLAFGKGEHLNCPNTFDGFGGQLSHAVVMAGNTAEIHVDDEEFLTVGSTQGINLVKLAVHEVGHALGFHHAPRNRSIMHAVYLKETINNFELDWNDRKMAQNAYGVCKGHFDTVFDFVRTRPDGKIIYNTYFFRKDVCWMYENRNGRPRYGDPRYVSTEWNGLPSENIDGYAHVWTPSVNRAYFFKGHLYWLYDSKKDEIASGYPRNISTDFGAIPGSLFPNIPNHLDTVYYDKRDGNLYFFKGSLVYAYDVSRGHQGCCLPGYPKSIKTAFPSAHLESSLPSNLDAVYLSYTDHTMYFFKGNRYWKNIGFNFKDKRTVNKIDGPWDVFTKWHDLCEVEL